MGLFSILVFIVGAGFSLRERRRLKPAATTVTSIITLLSFIFVFIIPQVHADTTLTYAYDANGNIIRGDGKYYEYNDANKLVRIRHNDQNGAVIAEYFYDNNGQRIKKVENGVTTYYIGKHYETEK